MAILTLVLPQILVWSNPSLNDCCGRQLRLENLEFASASGYVNVLVSEAKQMIESNPSLVILDVRSQAEYDGGHLQNATLIPVTELASRLGELDKQKDILVYCGVGGRSATASQTLVDNGFPSVYNMLGGITSWKNAGYWIEIIHGGDLIINGTQIFVIENCTYIQTGNIYVMDRAKLLVNNATIRMNQTYFGQYGLICEDYAATELTDTVFSSDYQISFEFRENASAVLDGLLIGAGYTGSTITFVDYSKGYVRRYSLRTGWCMLIFLDHSEVYVADSAIQYIGLARTSHVQIVSSRLQILELNFDTAEIVEVKDLNSGSVDYLDLKEKVSSSYGDFDVTLNGTTVNWWLNAYYDSKTTISNSTIAMFDVKVPKGVTANIEGLKPGFYDFKNVGEIKLNKTRITEQIRLSEDGKSIISNSTLDLMPRGDAEIVVLDSLVNAITTTDFVGSFCFNNVTFTNYIQTFRSDFYVQGNASCGQANVLYWFASDITRNYKIEVRDSHSEPTISNASLTLKSKENVTVWTETTDDQGIADLNLTFTDGNYTDSLRLEGVKGNLAAAANVSFLSDTPVTLVMGLHDEAIMDASTAKTVVGQGFNLPVNVTVANQGTFNETSNVTLYANETGVGTLGLDNPAGKSTTLTFDWNTTGFTLGNYTLTACAAPVPDETDTTDNNLTVGWVWVGLQGDIQQPFWMIDMKDVSYVAKRFLCLPSDPLWNSNADVNGDGKIDMKDISIVARHFGEHYP